MTAEDRISQIRSVTLGLTGLVCLAYAGLALVTGHPEPFAWWIPGAMGLASALIITVSAVIGGRRASEAASDELYQSVNHAAQRHAYWVNIAVFVVIAPLSANGLIDMRTGLAVIGTMMGASYLLLLVVYEFRLR